MAGPPTAYQIARFGQASRLITEAMQVKGLTAAELGKKLGVQSGNPAAPVYNWVNGLGAPGAKYRAQVAKILGLKQADIRPRDLAPDMVESAPAKPSKSAASKTKSAKVKRVTKTDRPSNAAKSTALVPYQAETPALNGTSMAHPQVRQVSPLSFEVVGNGQARVQLDVRLPVNDARALFMRLMDVDGLLHYASTGNQADV